MAGFAIDGGPLLALTRGAADAALLAAFGTLLALAWLAPPVLAGLSGDAPALARRLSTAAKIALLSAAATTVIWLALQSATMVGSVADTPMVLRHTLFGHLVIVRLALLGLAALALTRRRPWFATILAAAALATQAGHGHAWAMSNGPSWLLLSGTLHLLAAGAWLGGLPPLLLLVTGSPPRVAARALARFTTLGTVCVILLAATAGWQASILVVSLSNLVATAYGRVALFKLAGFTALLALAARNRFRLTPALDRPHPSTARLLVSIGLESGLGLLVILAAALLANLPPAIHA